MVNMDIILKKTFDLLKDKIDLNSLAITDLYLRADTTFVKLSNGNIGTSANYDLQMNFNKEKADYDPLTTEIKIKKIICQDPLLLNYFKKINNNWQRSLYLAIISALSQSFLNKKELSNLGLNMQKIMNDDSWLNYLDPMIKSTDTATLIGYGGGLYSFLRQNVSKLYISDYIFKNNKFLEKAVKELTDLKKELNFNGEVFLSCGDKNQYILSQSNVAFISGSALANKTMEDLLKYSNNCAKIIVQGPSASIYPLELFNRGVSDIFTNIKKEADIYNYKKLCGHSGDDKNYLYIYK